MKKLVAVFLFLFFTVFFFTRCNNATQKEPDATSAKDSADVTKTWKLGVQMWTFHYFSFDTALAKADSAGIKYIEAFPGQCLGAGLQGSFGIDMSARSVWGQKRLISFGDYKFNEIEAALFS